MKNYHIPPGKYKKKILFLALAMVFALVACGAVSAGTPLNENQSGTVSGDLYVNTSNPWASTTQGETNEVTQPNTLPSYTSIDSAMVYVNVYSGSGSANWPVRTTVKLDGNGDGDYDDPGEILGVEDMTSAQYSTDGTVYWLNDHCSRVYSDYQVWYDVTNLITSNNPTVYVKTEAMGGDGYDGRIKLLALTVAYNDTDTDQVHYWVLNGQDWINSDTSPSASTFNTGSFNEEVQAATLNTVALSSTDASYSFNGNSLSGGLTETGLYYKEHLWDVTSDINPGADSTLDYANVGGSFKMNLATLTIREATATPAPVAAFTSNVTSGSNPLAVQFTDQSTNNPTAWAWNFGDGTTSNIKNPTHTYTTAGTYTVTLTTSNDGGSDDEVKTGYITVNPNINLNIGGLVNTVPASAVFAKESNAVVVNTVRNQGTDTAYNIVINIYASDVNGGTTPVAQYTIASLAGGASTTVNMVDPTIRNLEGGTVTYTASIDPENLIAEINETDNIKSSAEKPLKYNGYKGKRYWEGGSDINTQLVYDLRGDIVYHTQPESAYKGVGWTTRTETWKASDLPVPSTSTIEDVWLFLSYNWDTTPGGKPSWTVTLNGQTIDLSGLTPYIDESNFGTYDNYFYGLYVVNVTSLYNQNGDNTLVMTPNSGNSQALYPSTLAVIYSDPTQTRKQIFISEECDLLGVSASSYGTTLEEATAYANFTGMTIDTSKVSNATLHSFAANAGPNEGNLFFNGNNIALNAWQGTSNTASALAADVKNYLTSTGNIARIQGTTSGGMATLQQFLVVEYADEGPLADFSGTPVTGDMPLTVQYSDKSTGYVNSYAWDFNNDGVIDSTLKNPVYTYSTPGTYTVKLTVSNSAGSDQEVKQDYISVNGPDLIITGINPNVGTGSYMFANEPNVLSVTVKNNGTMASEATTMDVQVGGVTYTVNVPVLDAGASTTVTVTDTASHTGGSSVPVTANPNPSRNIPETNTTNNSFSTNIIVYNNGYKGKQYTDDDEHDSLETQQVWEGHYNVIYSSGNTAYNGASWSQKTYSWSSSDLSIPSGATVVSARLYQSYTYNQMGVDPSWTMNFNGNLVNSIAAYKDIKGFGSYNFPYGLYVYDVTSLFNSAGNTMTITPEAGNNYGIYGAYLIVVYEDPATSQKKIYINDGFDMLCSRETYSVSDAEATAQAVFNNVNRDGVENAQAIAILASADEEGKSKFFFNGQEYTGFWSDFKGGSANPQTGFSVYDVTSALINGVNIAGIQSYDTTPGVTATYGDNMYVLGSILITELDATLPGVSADLAEGIYNSTKTVTLTATDNQDPNPKIYYTTDGTDPTTSNLYNGPLTLNTTTNLKFRAVDAAGNWSPLQVMNYIIDITLPQASADLNSGSYQTDQTVTLTATDTQDNNPEIYYSVNGETWQHQTKTVTFNLNTEGLTNLRFYAVDNAGNQGTVMERNYTIDKTGPTANSNLAEGTYNTPQNVTLTATDNLDTNPKIYYTTDGSNPTTTSNLYNGPVTISKTTTVKFMAVDAAGNPSQVYTRVYTIPNADVYVNSWVSNSNPQVGDTFIMTFKIGNNGPDNATGVVFTYLIPENFEYVGMTADSLPSPVYNPLTRTVTWNLGDLPVGDPVLNLILRVVSAGSSTSSPGILATTYDPVSANNAPPLTLNIRTPQTATTSQPVTASATSISTSTVPMQATGAPLAGLMVGILSILGGLGISREGKWKKLPLLLIVGVVFSLAFCGTVSADPYVGGQNLTTVQNGTVSGGLYEDSYYGFKAEDPKNVDYQFESLPENAQVKNATLYTVVYSAHMQESKDVYVNVSFNGQKLASEYFSSSYVYPMGSGTSEALTINDHTNRVTSDYLMWFDVTSLVQQNNWANVNTWGSYDGRIKLITLIIAYDDGDSDTISYWVNFGHDADTKEYCRDELGIDYVGQTSFESVLPTGSTVHNATLKVIHLASTDGLYTFNGNTQPNTNPQGDFSGSDVWNVTNNFNSFGTNTLTYNGLASWYKIVLSLLTVNYTGPVDERADLFASDLDTPSNPVVNQNYNLTLTIKNGGLTGANNFVVKLFDNENEVASQTVNSLNKGSTRKLTFAWTPTSTGLHNLKVVIDALGQVSESVETNNQLTKALYVEPERPDLIPEGLTIPTDPKVYQNYQLTATISNNGLANAGGFQVKLYDGSTLLGTQTIASLVKGGATSILFNWKPTTTGSHTLKLVVDTLNQVNESSETNNQLNRYVIMNDAGVINVFIISDSPGTNIANLAALEILDKMGGTVSIQIRSGVQVEAMSEDELRAYLSSCDIFLGEWITTNAATLLTSVLKNHPEIANKPNGVFLILEPPVSTTSSTVDLMKYSNIMGVKLLENFTTNQLLDYYENTKRGGNYTNVTDYLATVNFPTNYNLATLYKVLNDKDSTKNQILWALNLIGVETQFEAPAFSANKQQYGIYRYRWYTLEEYMAVYFKSNRQGTVGLIESTMYVDSQMLQTYYAIIESLEAQGLNVIPVTAYGGTTTQLQVMVQAFTNATSYQNFITNSTAYATYVDSIVEMAAYGLGGESFTDVVNFLSVLNVPVVRAIHSDVISNEQWELESSGLPTDDGSKWWHVAILEAQGIIEYTFVGGKSTTIDSRTGAAIVGYDPQEENIEYMAKRVASWVKLQYMDNADKLIAMIYYNYPPGKDNIGSSYLDTITSIYNLLNVLKAEGYTVENIPANATDLEELMITLGINVANWAPGELQKLANNPNIILYPVSDYLEWFNQLDDLAQLQVVEGPVAYIGELCKRSVALNYTAGMESRIDAWYSGMLSLLPDNKYSVAKPVLDDIVSTLKKYVNSHNTADYNTFLTYKQQFLNLKINGTTGWGEAPGDIMVVEKNGIKYFVIPGLQFGNIFIGPEPQRGWEGDIAKLYHSSTVSPPHQYLAYFAYLQEKGTNAMVFMGRHATHEWLPGKELVLSPNDFPSICVGNVPQIYFYIVDGLAEGIQAKRRGYAVIISHLTPPMTFTSLYGDLGTLATLADQYDTATSAQQATIITQVKSLIASNHYDLGVDTSTLSNDGLIAALEAYLDNIQSTLYPYGLHAIGQAWTPDEIALLVTSILSVEFEVTNTTESTSLHNEISLLVNGKPYDSLTALEKENVQEKCIDVVTSLLYWDVDTVANILSSAPSANLKFALKMAKYYIWAVNQSVANEVTSFLNALNGGYIIPGAGGDPVGNPDVLPTGTNFYHDQGAEIPTKEAYEYSKVLALLLLADITDNTEKIAMGIWCVETARDDGALVALVLQLLGMEPVWSDSPSAGVDGQKLKEMPAYLELADLVRPDGWSKKRIDVTIITSGLFRDLYSRQAQLLDNAFRVTLARSYYTIINNANLQAKYGDKLKTSLDIIMEGIGYYGAGYESLDDNYVAKHWVEDFEYYLTLNMTPEIAGEMAITRIFAPPEGDYGAGISKLVSESWTWEDRMELGQFYLNRMANMYSHNNWGTSNVAVFSRALSGIGTVFTSRNTNLYGVVDNDDFFDYWGGLSMALEYINGKAPDMYVLDYSNRAKPDSISLEQYMNRELTTRYFNPGWIEGMMKEGYSGARYMSKKFTSNLLGWQMTRPGSVQNWMWDKVVDVYLRDAYNMGVTSFLKSGNNAYSMISLTGTLLTAAFEGYWSTDASTLSMVANTWAQMVITNGVACCDCSCGNLAMMEWATTYVNADLLAHLNSMLYEATQQAAFAPGQTPQSDPTGSTSTGAQSSSSQSSSQSQDSGASGSTAGEEESESTTTPGEEGEGKTYEVSKDSSGGTSESGLPIAAIVGVIALVCLVGFGYFRGSFKGK